MGGNTFGGSVGGGHPRRSVAAGGRGPWQDSPEGQRAELNSVPPSTHSLEVMLSGEPQIPLSALSIFWESTGIQKGTPEKVVVKTIGLGHRAGHPQG